MMPRATPRPPQPEIGHVDLPPPPIPVPVAAETQSPPAPPPPRARLTALTPGGPRALSPLYSQIVGLLKFALPAAALGIAALVLLWPQL
jgi:hypothetical protein